MPKRRGKKLSLKQINNRIFTHTNVKKVDRLAKKLVNKITSPKSSNTPGAGCLNDITQKELEQSLQQAIKILRKK